MAFCSKCGKELTSGAAFCQNCGTPVQGNGPAGTAAGSAVPVSGIDAVMKEKSAQDYWLRRLIAFVIDGVIFYVVIAIIAALIAIPTFIYSAYTGGFNPFTFIFGSGLFTVLSGFLFVLYFTIAEFTRGATLGKSVMRLRVTSKSGGAHPDVTESFTRNITKVYWILLLLDVVVGLAVERDYQRKFTDRLAGTSVVSR